MDFTRSPLFPYLGVRWAAVVRKTPFWLVVQLHMGCLLSLLHVDASVTLAPLNVTELPKNQVHTGYSNINRNSEASSLFVQDKFAPRPPAPVDKGASGLDPASLAFREETALESGEKTGGEKNIPNTGTAARVNGTDRGLQVRFAPSQVPPSRSTFSQNNHEEAEHSTNRRPISRETLEGWARGGTASTYTVMSEADDNKERFGSPYSAFRRPVDSSPLSAPRSPNKPPTIAGSPLEKQAKYPSADAVPALISLQRVLHEQVEPVAPTSGTTGALRGTSRPEGLGPSTFTSPDGWNVANRDAVISPYDAASAAVPWLPAAPTGPPGGKLFDTQLPAVFDLPDRTLVPPAEVFDGNLQRQEQQHLNLSPYVDNAPQPQQSMMGDTYSLQGRTYTTPGQRAEMGQGPQIGEIIARPWYQRVADQFFFPSPDEQQQNSLPREAAPPQGVQIFKQQAQGGAPPQGAQAYPVYQAPAAGELRPQNGAGSPASNPVIQSELHRLGYTEARGVPPTKGLKTIASGIALGLSGLAPLSAAALLGIGAIRFMESKRAQGKAHALGGQPMP